jgi:hypothetical protein
VLRWTQINHGTWPIATLQGLIGLVRCGTRLKTSCATQSAFTTTRHWHAPWRCTAGRYPVEDDRLDACKQAGIKGSLQPESAQYLLNIPVSGKDDLIDATLQYAKRSDDDARRADSQPTSLSKARILTTKRFSDHAHASRKTNRCQKHEAAVGRTWLRPSCPAGQCQCSLSMSLG